MIVYLPYTERYVHVQRFQLKILGFSFEFTFTTLDREMGLRIGFKAKYY